VVGACMTPSYFGAHGNRATEAPFAPGFVHRCGGIGAWVGGSGKPAGRVVSAKWLSLGCGARGQSVKIDAGDFRHHRGREPGAILKTQIRHARHRQVPGHGWIQFLVGHNHQVRAGDQVLPPQGEPAAGFVDQPQIFRRFRGTIHHAIAPARQIDLLMLQAIQRHPVARHVDGHKDQPAQEQAKRNWQILRTMLEAQLSCKMLGFCEQLVFRHNDAGSHPNDQSKDLNPTLKWIRYLSSLPQESA